MFAFTANTWQGGDYIPRVWDAWLADPHGAFVVGVDAADRPLAVGKLSVADAAGASPPSLSTQHAALGTGSEGWLEGIRVAPAVRGQGWGRALTAYLVERADERELATVRFITEHDNAPVHRIAAALAFEREGEYHPHRGAAGGDAAARRAAPAEAAALWEAVWAGLAPAVPFRWQRWAAALATTDWFNAAVAEGRVLVAADNRSLAVVAHEPGAPSADLALLASAPEALAELLPAARAWAARAGAERILGLLPPPAVPAAVADGWEPYTAEPMVLYRRYGGG